MSLVRLWKLVLDRKALRAAVHGVAKSQTWLSNWTELKLLKTWQICYQFSSVAQSCPTLRLHWLQIAKAPCPSPTPGVYSNSCPLNQWCHPMSHPLSSPSPPIFNLSQHQGLLKMSQLFSTGGQSTGVSTSASILPMNTQDWSPLGWTGWISLQSKGLSSVFFSTTVQSINYSALSFLYSPPLTSIHEYWKSHSLD